MRAIVCTDYGLPEVMQLREVEKPTPKDHEVLIKVHASTVTSADVRIRTADPFPVKFFYGFPKPKTNTILGSEVAGEVEAIGNQVTRFKPGDQVFAGTGVGLGGNAEYVCLAETAAIALKPTNMTYEEAAAIPFGGATALIFLRDKGKIQSGQRVLVYGASGALGRAAVQMAKFFGAEVTGVCSTPNLELVKSLGADEVVDYTQEDFTQRGKTYDIVFDTSGKSPFSACLSALTQNGTYLRAVHINLSPVLRGIWVSMTGSKKVIGGVAIESQENLLFLKELAESGKLRSVIAQCYPLEQAGEAHRAVERRQRQGTIVITLAENSKD